MKTITLRFVLLSVTLIFLTACSPAQIKEIDLGSSFVHEEVEGSFLFFDTTNDTWSSFNFERCQTRFIPASTFKILNALIALDSGVIADKNEIIPWDGTQWPVESWNQDHDLASAMKYSAVWYYEELARRVGSKRIQEYIDKVGYGNQKTTGPNTAFWLFGDTRISQQEQIEFLIKFYKNELPFSPEDQEIVKNLILLEVTETYRLYGKTGWATSVEPDTGWFVGYLERDDQVYFFATNLEKEGSQRSLGAISKGITVQILTDWDLID